MKKVLWILVFVSVAACDPQPQLIDGDLDTIDVLDASLIHPERYLVSAMYPNPDAATLRKTVVIAVHGFTASTYEWDELRTYLNTSTRKDSVLVSQVLLGGHGRSFRVFKASSWHDWQRSIIDEYERLVDLGYTRFVFATSSTGGTLLLELFSKKYFTDKVPPIAAYLIDPLIIPASKLLSIIPVMGPVIGYAETELEDGAEKYWYRYRPHQTLQQLNIVTNKVRRSLENGVRVGNTDLRVYQSRRDPSADPATAVLIYKGAKSNSGRVFVEMVDSELHVFTRLQSRKPGEVLPRYVMLQQSVFDQIISH